MATKKPTQLEVVRAVTNSPELAVDEFTLGDKTFKVVDLGYDDYLRFTAHLGPVLEVFFSSLVGMTGFKTQDSAVSITPKAILDYAGDSLPEMACIVCNQTDPTVTVTQVKQWAQKGSPKGPFKLADIVLKQIEQNKIVNDFASFFGQMLPMMKAALNLNL